MISFLKKTSKDAQIQFSGNILNDTENYSLGKRLKFVTFLRFKFFSVISDAIEQKYEKNEFHILPNTLKPS